MSRDVITDLHALCLSGTASAATQALVEESLAQDPPLARMLRERAAAYQRRKAAQRHGITTLMFAAILFSAFAFGRVVADTTWRASPAGFIATALIAVVLWIALGSRVVWLRRHAMERAI